MSRYPYLKEELVRLKNNKRYLIMLAIAHNSYSDLYSRGLYPAFKNIFIENDFEVLVARNEDEAMKKLKQLAIHQIYPDALVLDGSEFFQYYTKINEIKACALPYSETMPIAVALCYTSFRELFTKKADYFFRIQHKESDLIDGSGNKYVKENIWAEVVGLGKLLCELGRLRKKELSRKK